METILHSLDGQPCTCTLHDIGYNCRRALTEDSLDRQVSELVRVAFLSGFDAEEINTSFQIAIYHRVVEGSK